MHIITKLCCSPGKFPGSVFLVSKWFWMRNKQLQHETLLDSNKTCINLRYLYILANFAMEETISPYVLYQVEGLS
jgi:hypothetical protein